MLTNTEILKLGKWEMVEPLREDLACLVFVLFCFNYKPIPGIVSAMGTLADNTGYSSKIMG